MDKMIYVCTNDIHMANKLEEFDPLKLTTSPYKGGLLIPVTKTYSTDQFTLHTEPGENGLGTYLPSGFYIEKTQASRVYYSAGMKDVVYNLSDRAQRLYLYILYNMIKGKDYVQINKEYYMKKNNIKSRITYAAAIKELIRYNFIVQTMYKTVYWTNPMMFTSGNRIKQYPDNLDVKGEL